MEHFLGGPGFLSPRSTLGSDISLFLALAFTFLFILSGRLAKKKRSLAHHRMILLSVAAMFGYFIYYYKIRRLGYASLGDQANFHGSEWAFFHIFKPLLYLHFTVVALAISTAFYTVINGFRSSVRREGEMALLDKPARPSKILWGAGLVWLAFLLWWLFLSRFSLHANLGTGFIVMFLTLGYFLPAGIALVIHRALPIAEQRHRFLGKLSVILFACLMLTSVITWSMLYIF